MLCIHTCRCTHANGFEGLFDASMMFRVHWALLDTHHSTPFSFGETLEKWLFLKQIRKLVGIMEEEGITKVFNTHK